MQEFGKPGVDGHLAQLPVVRETEEDGEFVEDMVVPEEHAWALPCKTKDVLLHAQQEKQVKVAFQSEP